MAAFDSDQRKILVRVVYDGPGFAGKTTNIQQLHGFFTERRRGDLLTPEERDGRTQYFDWMHLDGGLVHGYGLRCQLVSVPGQQSFTRRRWLLLRRADVVVFVCDSTPEGLEDASSMFHMLHEYLEHRYGSTLPLVVQANKQDLSGALDPQDIRQRLGIAGDVPIVPATADVGAGVRETVVLAIRAAANRIQKLLLDQGIEGLSQDLDTAEGLLAELRELPQPVAPPVAVEPAEEPPPQSQPPVEAVAPEPQPQHRAEAADSEPEGSPEGEESPPDIPPCPGPDVMSGFIWPAATGRDVLRSVQSAGDAVLRRDLVSQNGRAAGSGGSHLLLFEAGMWCLKTSPRRRYADVDEARAALLRLARHKTALGSFLPPRTVLSLQTDSAGEHWLWTVCPWMTPLRTSMEHAHATQDDAALLQALCHYADAVVGSLCLAARRGVLLDIHPSNFAVVGDDVYYIDDDIDDGTQVASFGHSVLQRVVEYEHHPTVMEHYMDGLVERMKASLNAQDVRACGLRASLRGFGARSATVSSAYQRLATFLEEVARRPAG